MKKVHRSLAVRLTALLVTVLLLASFVPAAFAAEADPLKPADKVYDDNNIILSKQAERIGPEEWEITVKATIKEEPIVRQGLEVIFVLDTSGSMLWCTDEVAHNAGDHKHKTSCYGPVCGIEEHSHGEECYKAICGIAAHEHGDGCYIYSCGSEAHEHTQNNCYVRNCGLSIHEHKRTNQNSTNCYRSTCTKNNNRSHWNGNSHIADTTCYRSGNSYYQLTCTKTEHKEHTDDCYVLDCNTPVHSHSESCVTFTCVKTPHTHKQECLELECTTPVHSHDTSCNGLICKLGNDTDHEYNSPTECTYVDSNGKTQKYQTRIDLAKSTINTLVDNLNNEFGETGISFRYVIFSGSGYKNGVNKSGQSMEVDSLTNVTAEGGTYMYHGINTGLDMFNENSTDKKMLVIITDGAATDKIYQYEQLSTKLSNFKNPSKTDGVIYTIGFSYENDDLADLAGNGGKYIHAGNEAELKAAMGTIENSISAMLVDPMGSSVGFTVGSVEMPVSSVAGSVKFDNNTLYWNPTEETEFKRATIEYSYTVSLNHNADRDVNSYSDVALNDPTYLLYGVENSSTTDMKSAAFPIPKAKYAVSSVQVNWKCGNTNIKEPTETEKIIADFEGIVRSTGEYYTPAFETDYTTITKNIPQSGHNVYRYIGTTITRNGVEVDAVNPKDVAAYVVTHNYVLEEVYEVVYEYVGDVPAGASAAYLNNTYAKPGEQITVAANPTLDGWIFSGWTVAQGGAQVENGQFTMPGNDVKLVGSWTEKPYTYTVDAMYYTSVDGEPYQPDCESPEVLVSRTETTETQISYDFSGNFTYNDNTYTSVQLAEGSDGAMVGNTVTAVFDADHELAVSLVFYREIFSDADYVVKHEYNVIRADGTSETEETITTDPITGKHGDVIAASGIEAVPTASGKQYDEISRSGDITLTKDATQEIVITYVRYEYQVEVEGDAGVESTSGAGIYNKGEDAQVGYSLKKGYELVSVNVDGSNVNDNADEALLFAAIDANHKVIITTREIPKGKAIVHYVDSNGMTLQADLVSEEIYVGDTYDVREAKAVTTITVDGVVYDFVSDDTEANDTDYTGEMPEAGVEITRTYAERSKATATVHYVDSNRNTLQADLVSDAIYVGDTYNVSEAKAVATITVNGITYDFVSDDTEANGTDYTGEMIEGGVEITRTYAERGKATATVHYVDTNGNTLQPDLVSDAIYVGDTYDVREAKAVATITVNGITYDFVSDDTEANGTDYTGEMPEGGVEITRTYAERGKATATVHYVDTNGNTLQPDLVSDAIYVGDTYDVREAKAVATITVNGITYDFVSDDTEANGTAYNGEMPEGGVEITRTYAERGKATATVHYVDTNGNTLQPDLVSDAIYVGDTYNVSEAKAVATITVNGITYDFVSDDTEANGTDYTGEMLEGGVEITRTYAERSKATATVHYVDTNGNTLQPDLVSDAIYVGDTYDVSEAKTVITITVNGTTYDFVSDDTEANGTDYTGEMPEGGVEITRTYAERSKATATVHYVDTNGNTLRADTTDESYIGSSYDVSIAETILTITVNGVDYNFVSEDSTAYNGEMPEGGVEITRTYAERSKATATVHYVDTNGNTLQPDLVSDAIYVGDTYDVREAEAVTSITANGTTYDFVSDDTTANGTDYTGEMPPAGVEITRTYAERGKAIAIVRFVDEEGNMLREDFQTSEIYIGNEYDLTATQEIVSIQKDGSEYAFSHDYQAALPARLAQVSRADGVSYKAEMPADGIMIVRVYKLVEVTYYYQQKYVFTVYDPDGNITYSGMEQWPVTPGSEQTVTITAPEKYTHQEREYSRTGAADQTADLTGTTAERPYVFVVNYEIHEVNETTPKDEITTLPPQTGDDGICLWLTLMLGAGVAMVMLMIGQRKREH